MILDVILHVLVPCLSSSHFFLKRPELFEFLSLKLLPHGGDDNVLLLNEFLLLSDDLLLSPLLVLLEFFLLELNGLLLNLVSLSEFLLLDHVLLDLLEVQVLGRHLWLLGQALFKTLREFFQLLLMLFHLLCHLLFVCFLFCL